MSSEKRSEYEDSLQSTVLIDSQPKNSSQSLPLKPIDEIRELFEKCKRGKITLQEILKKEDQNNQVRI